LADRTARTLEEFFDALLAAYGPQQWWPALSAFEVIVGAILTQNTNWRNVERAIENLRRHDRLDPHSMHELAPHELAELIRPAGTFNVKARRLVTVVAWIIERFDGSIERMRDEPTDRLREELLSLRGVGRETADAILLYALSRPRFVVDAYTHRVMTRHGLIEPEADYDQLQALFEDNLPADVEMFNEYHALLVEVGKRHCRRRAQCEECPLEKFPHDAQAT
jgi:endonuclease-3 related protein